MMEYTDFKNINTIWGWVHDGESYQFKEVRLNNLIAGDTDSSMLSLKEIVYPDMPLDDVCDIADTLGELTNASFPDFCVHAFNCPEERKHLIKTEREIVSDKSLFLSKKRYIMNVLDKEGNRTKHQKTMGVQIKKSDTPEAVKVLLQKLVDMILDGKSIREVKGSFSSMREEYEKSSPFDLARPISVNGLKKYTEMLEATGSMKGFPYQIKAALFYNSLCSNTDKKIVPGDKVMVLYIKGQKSPYIAFPVDLNVLPPFMDNIVIDYDTMWEKAYKVITSYMESMGWDVKSRRKQVAKKLFGI